MRGRDHAVVVLGLGFAVAVAVQVAYTPPAHACGCLSPPAVSEGEYAVNQSAEQIIFEVEPGWVTAHVLIKYAGEPASFAWIVPVPEAPELGLSPASAFGLLDSVTEPIIQPKVGAICRIWEWACDSPSGAGFGCGGGGAAGDDGDDGDDGADGFGADAQGGGNPPVTVIAEEVVGDYQTVTFSASEAQ